MRIMLLAALGTMAAAPATAQVVPAGDAAIGAKLFIQCRACHNVKAGAPNSVGPNLAGVMGTTAGQLNGYIFSPALAKSGVKWDVQTMDAWLKRPSALVPGNKMAFGGMANPKARADMIAYLATLSAK